MSKNKKEPERMSKEQFDSEEKFGKKMEETKLIFQDNELMECFGYYGTRNITADMKYDKVVANVEELSACVKCKPETRELCFKSSFLRTIAIIFK